MIVSVMLAYLYLRMTLLSIKHEFLHFMFMSIGFSSSSCITCILLTNLRDFYSLNDKEPLKKYTKSGNDLFVVQFTGSKYFKNGTFIFK